MQEIGFLLLCGGQSRRMGTPKALIDVDGEPLFRVIARAGEGFSERLCSVNDSAIPTPPGFVRLADLYRERGPLGGIHTALRHTRCAALVVAPCDTPGYCAALAQFLRERWRPEDDVLILEDQTGRPHPTMGVYGKSALAVIEDHVVNDKLKIMRMLDLLRTRVVRLPQGMEDDVFCNLNTQEDLRRYQAGRKTL